MYENIFRPHSEEITTVRCFKLREKNVMNEAMARNSGYLQENRIEKD